MKKELLICGILSSLFYIAMNVFIPLLFEGYSYSSHTVSELSAIGAPTRQLWVPLAFVYTLLFAAFGFGVLKIFKWESSLKDFGNHYLCLLCMELLLATDASAWDRSHR